MFGGHDNSVNPKPIEPVNITNIRNIDVTNLTKENEIILGAVLENRRLAGELFTNKDKIYDCPAALKLKIANVPDQIRLNRSLSFRESASDSTTHRYDVLSGELIGNGSFGEIHDVDAVLEPRSDGSVFYKSGKQRVVKIQKVMPDPIHKLLHYFLLQQETTLTARTNLRSKKSIYFHDGVNEKNVLTMRRVPGSSLGNFLKNDAADKIAKKNTTTVDTRLKLSLAVLKAVRSIHLKNIVHRDIKADNIMPGNFADFVKADPIDAFIIDFGFSTDIVKNDDKSELGTPLYQPYESFIGQSLTQQSDIYSTGWIMALIWRADDNLSKTKSQAESLSANCNFMNMFSGITEAELNKDYQNRIDKSVHKMVVKDADKRIALDEMIALFETILIETRLAALAKEKTVSEIAEIRDANCLGLCIRDDLEAAALKDKLSNPKRFLRFKEILTNAVNSIIDKEVVVAEFVRCLDVAELRGLKTKKDLTAKLDAILSNFTSAKDKLDALQTQLNTSAGRYTENGQQIQARITHLLQMDNGNLTIDEVARMAKKYNKQLPRIEKDIADLKVLLAMEKMAERKDSADIRKLAAEFTLFGHPDASTSANPVTSACSSTSTSPAKPVGTFGGNIIKDEILNEEWLFIPK